ncbi:MAG: peptidyl-prolyl cis-trans isomerase [Ignavibacteriaceae bacterium]
MKPLTLKFILLLIPWVTLYPQTGGEDYLAKAGYKTITTSEFIERYEMTPGFRRHVKGMEESTQLEFLFTIVAEKLFALEARELRLDTTEVITFSTRAFEKMFVRDALFQREVKNKISVTEEEIILAAIRNASRLYVNFLFSEDEEEINQLYHYLNQGVPFDSILAESPERNEQLSPIQVTFGQLEESIEDSVFNLKVGDYTKPLLTPDGWYIFKLVNRSENIFITEGDKDEAMKTLIRIVEGRKLRKRQAEFYLEFFSDQKVEVNPAIFESLAQKISVIVEYKKNNFDIKQDDPVHFDAYDVISIENQFGEDTLSMPFIKLDENPISTQEFIRSIAFDGFNITDYKLNFVRASLDLTTRRVIEYELFYREGIKRGYQDLPEVKNEVERWVDNYLFQKLQNRIVDSINVTDQEVKDYYEMLNQPKHFPVIVNIIEVLTSELEIVDTVLAELNKGTDIKLLAARYSERDFTAGRNGEFGRFAVTSHGEIGRIAETMEIGDIYGPLKVPEGYSIFKLIEKYDEYIEPLKPFEQVKEQYRMDLMFDKAKLKLTDYTYNLAVKYNVELNLNGFDNIEVTSLPSFGIRHLGFGGKITAVPILAPNVEWAYRWIQNQGQQIIP